MMKKKFLFVTMATVCLVLVACQRNSNGGESSAITPEQSSNSSEEQQQYNIVRPEFTPDYDNYDVSASPSGFNMTYYSDIYSRGFSWITDENTTDTKLYLVESDKGEAADFSNAELKEGEAVKVTLATDGTVSFADNSHSSYKGSSNSSQLIINSHKVHVENLKKGKAYSYKENSKIIP